VDACGVLWNCCWGGAVGQPWARALVVVHQNIKKVMMVLKADAQQRELRQQCL